MNSDIKTIDDFLPENQFLKIKNQFLGNTFPWFYQPTVVTDDDSLLIEKNNFQFTHCLMSDNKPISPYFKLIVPILDKLKCGRVYRVKLNLLPKTEKRIEHGYHIDIIDSQNIKTAILYLNTNNGMTLFKNGSSVKSKENRMVIFDNQIPHTGTTCTDENVRCVLNLNYIEM